MTGPELAAPGRGVGWQRGQRRIDEVRAWPVRQVA